MSFTKPILILVAALLLGTCGCKTNEKNYKKAYDAAKAHAQERTGLDETIYAKVRKEAKQATLIVEGDSIPMQAEVIGYTLDGGMSQEGLQKYNVVVGRYKQLFNAQEMRRRLKEGHHPETFIIHTREPLYYVITKTTPSTIEARDEYHQVQADSSIVMRPPLPFILVPAHKAR